MVQDILSPLGSDNINSVTDTNEAQDVARILRDVYNEMVANDEVPLHRRMIQLTALGDSSKPNYLQVPTATRHIELFKYNKALTVSGDPEFKEVLYKTPEDFLRLVHSRQASDTNVETIIDFSNVKLFILNDVHPTYWTTFDDNYIVTDSFYSPVESTLQESKSMVYAQVTPDFELTNDDFVPVLNDEAFPLLLAEAKAVASVTLKQSVNSKFEQQARRRRIRRQNERSNFVHNPLSRTPNYGRKRR